MWTDLQPEGATRPRGLAVTQLRSHGDGVEREKLGHRWSLMNRGSALVKRTQRALLPLPPAEDTAR